MGLRICDLAGRPSAPSCRKMACWCWKSATSASISKRPFPELEAVWLETSAGEDQVLLLTRDALARFQQP